MSQYGTFTPYQKREMAVSKAVQQLFAEAIDKGYEPSSIKGISVGFYQNKQAGAHVHARATIRTVISASAQIDKPEDVE